MSETDTTERYTCLKCGYTNIWTHAEIRQRGQQEIYRGDNEVIYTLRCKNPAGCDQRTRVAVPRQKG